MRARHSSYAINIQTKNTINILTISKKITEQDDQIIYIKIMTKRNMAPVQLLPEAHF